MFLLLLHSLLFIPMHIKNPITKLVLGTLLLTALPACSKDTPSSSIQEGRSAANEVYQTFALDIPAEEDSAAIEKQSQAVRSIKLNLTKGTTVPIVPKLNKGKDGIKDSVQTIVTLYNKTKQRSHSAIVWWVNETRKHISPHPYYYMRDIQLPASMTANIDTDEWYLIAVAGGGNYTKSNQRLSVTGTTNLTPVQPGQKVEWEAPFATPWRRLKWDKPHRKFLLHSMTQVVKFRPQGIYLVLQVENRANLGVDITRNMRLEGNGYASKGYYDFSAASIQNHLNQVHDDQDAVARLWVTTNEETRASRESATFRDQNHPHYLTEFTLGPATGETSAKIHLNKRTGPGTPTRYTNTYVLWLQKIDPYWDRAATDASGNDEKNIIYAPVEVNEPGRTTFVERKALVSYNYAQDPHIERWKPYLGSRYIMGSIKQGVQAGKAHLKTLRIVRPFLPIEYTGAEVYYWNRSSLDNKLPWRRPYTKELSPLLRIPTDYLREAYQQAPHKADDLTFPRPASVDLGGDIGIVQYDFNNDPWEVGIGAIDYDKMSWMFSRVPGSNTIYGIGYRNYQNPNGSWRDKTNNYAVAIRITLNIPYNKSNNGKDIAQNSGGSGRENAKIEHYYLGPNFDVGYKPLTSATYVMTPQFWKYCIDDQAIISRVFPFRDTSSGDQGVEYWVWPPADRWQKDRIAITNKSDINYHEGGRANQHQWNQPWLNKPAW